MKRKQNERLTAFVAFRLKESEFKKIKLEAAENLQSVSDLIRNRILTNN